MRKPPTNYRDLTGTRFNRLFIVGRKGNDKKGHAMWECLCDCGKTTYVDTYSLTSKNTTSCGCYHRERISFLKRTGTKNVSGQYWGDIRIGARKRNIEFKITIEYVQELLVKQNFKCALSGIPLNSPLAHADRHDRNASIDRIDSNVGYIEGNIQWVHKDVNRMKNAYPQDHFINMCKLIVENQHNQPIIPSCSPLSFAPDRTKPQCR